MADYEASARYDDEIQVKARAGRIGRPSIRLDYEVTKLPSGELLCTGHTVHVLIGKDGRTRTIPVDFRKRFSK